MEVVGFVGTAGDAVDVDAGEGGVADFAELDVGFLHGFAGGGVAEGEVVGFDVAAGEEPAVQAMVVHEEHGALCGSASARERSARSSP